MSAAAAFYTERIPEQWNRVLDEQRAQGGEDDRVYRGLVAVDTSLCAVVEGERGGTFHLNVDAGRMTPGDAPKHPAFLTLVHDAEALDALARESGNNALGFLGGVAGLTNEIKLTRQRLELLRELQGSLRFTLQGARGFTLLAHFGPGPPATPPSCEICVDAEAYAELREGRLEAQDAFMTGRIDVQGEMQMAMQLALAVLAPD